MKTVSLKLVTVLSTGLGLFLLSTIQVSAQPLVMNTPTGSMTHGANISINPEELLPATGTISISTEGAGIQTGMLSPPEGVTVVYRKGYCYSNESNSGHGTAEDDTGDDTEEEDEPEEGD